MQITNVQESGSTNILRWAISNGANIKDDVPLQSLINDELFYLVTLSDVNFFELVRLTQMYREKLRIISEHQANIPSVESLTERFPGKCHIDEESPEDETHLYTIAENVIEQFLNLTTQMVNDDDIINPSARRLFLPMITRTFDVQIPVAFIDFIESMSHLEAIKMFVPEYPNTLKYITEDTVHGIRTTLAMGFVKGTSIIRYDTRYDKYLKLIKYAPLKRTAEDKKLYKTAVIGFSKRDTISRGEARCNFFNSNSEDVSNCIKRLGKMNTSLKIDFAVQLPLQYLQILENTFDRNVLSVGYESSISTIIDGGLVYNDFEFPMYDEDTKDPVEKEKLEKYNNSISLYRTRIAEANQLMLNAITILAKADDVDITSVFAMLPSIYSAKVVITIDMDEVSKYHNISDPMLNEMLKEMIDAGNGILRDINKSK